LSHACEILGFGQLTGGGGPFRQPVLAQIIEPASELDSLRAGQRRGPAAVLSRAAAPRADLCYRGAGLAAACRPGAPWGPGVEISRPVPGRSAGIRPGHPGRHMFAQPWLRRRPSRATGWSCSPGAQDG